MKTLTSPASISVHPVGSHDSLPDLAYLRACPATADHVTSVVLDGASVEVIRVNTAGIVAVVTDEKSFGNLALKQSETEHMSAGDFVIDVQGSIASSIVGSIPKPARPESLNNARPILDDPCIEALSKRAKDGGASSSRRIAVPLLPQKMSVTETRLEGLNGIDAAIDTANHRWVGLTGIYSDWHQANSLVSTVPDVSASRHHSILQEWGAS